jgi:hypothetical protein
MKTSQPIHSMYSKQSNSAQAQTSAFGTCIAKYTMELGNLNVYRMGVGAVMPNEMHYLPRIVMSLKEGMDCLALGSSNKQSISADQALLFHPYFSAEIMNAHLDDQIVFSFAFMTMEPIQAPNIRILTSVITEKNGITTRKFKLPDWELTQFVIPPGADVTIPFVAGPKNMLIYHWNEPEDMQWQAVNDNQTIYGGELGSTVIVFEPSQELAKSE